MGVLLACWLGLMSASTQASCPAWPLWQRFKSLYVSADGRVVDASTPAQITTSEGQSYALLFALAANDREAFARVLSWTQNNLAHGDLAARLPAWQWGRAADTQWQVLDDNPASDADVWLAYALSEAGRLWNAPRYTQLSRELSSRILREESALVPGLGLALLPAPRGFVSNQTWRFNASYLPLQALRLLATAHNPLWQQIITSSLRIISASSPHGLATDWIEYRSTTGFSRDAATQGVGSYNAIRVYLWAGMLASDDPEFAGLTKRLSPALAQFEQQSRPAERMDTEQQTFQGDGSPGFSAAYLPLLKNRQQTAALTRQLRFASQSLNDNQHYFSDALSLFGRGWLEGWLRFASSGQLQVKWSRACAAAA